jgi:hypothetical protein
MNIDTQLSPAQMCVMLNPNAGSGFPPIKATLLLLLTTGVLRMEETEESGFFRPRKVMHLRIAAEPKQAPPEIAALLDVVRAAQPGGTIAEVVGFAKRAFKGSCNDFNLKYILPSLVARCLLEPKKVLFIKSHAFTPAGKAEQDRIKSDLRKCDEVARLLDHDPTQAAALAATLGATVLISDKLSTRFKPLADAMRDRSGADASLVADGTPGTSHFDFSHFNGAGFDLGQFDSSAIDAMHHGMSSFDSGFSDAGDGGGHDGGGGGHH